MHVDLLTEPGVVDAGNAWRSATTFCEAFQATAAEAPERPAIRTADGACALSWGEYAEQVRETATGLAALGVGPGDTVALMMSNRPEFHVVDAAAMHLGAIPFSIYNTSTSRQISDLLNNATPKIAVCEQQFVGRLREATRGSTVEHLVDVDARRRGRVPALADLRSLPAPDDFDFDACWRSVDPGNVLTLIYTSGTTGAPKGVELTHGNLFYEIHALDRVLPLPAAGGDVVSYLPMAHIAERMVSHYLPMLLGFTVTCCPDPAEMLALAARVHPVWFFGVPRIWEKLHAAITGRLEALPDGARADVERCLDAARTVVAAEQRGEDAPPDAVTLRERGDATYFAPLRTQLGLDRVDLALAGSAPTPVEVLEFFHAIGVPIREMWGMTETSVTCTANTPEATRLGTVGRPLPGIEVTLASDSEICVRGPVVMRGYRNDPEQTRNVIDEEGWLHTGDLGAFDDDGFLRIIGRKKELIITAGGKNVSPANIEAAVKSASPLIGQVVAVGDGRPYLTALITVDPLAAVAYAERSELDTNGSPPAEHPALRAAVATAVTRANEQLSRVEQIKRFHVLAQDWEPSSDELTPTMKLKRAAIAEKYADVIDALYRE